MLSNKAILNDTLRIIEDGYYTKDEQLVMLKYSTEESQESIVILPDEVKQIYNKCFVKGSSTTTLKFYAHIDKTSKMAMAEKLMTS